MAAFAAAANFLRQRLATASSFSFSLHQFPNRCPSIIHQTPRLYSSQRGLGLPVENRNLQDHKRRLLAAKYELRRKLYKAFCKDPDLPGDMRDKQRSKLSKLPRNSSFTRVRNRCIITGRSRAVYKFFRISRIVFRGLASQGQLMGVKKSSW